MPIGQTTYREQSWYWLGALSEAQLQSLKSRFTVLSIRKVNSFAEHTVDHTKKQLALLATGPIYETRAKMMTMMGFHKTRHINGACHIILLSSDPLKVITACAGYLAS